MNINDLANQFREQLLSKEARAAARMVRAYGAVALRLERDGRTLMDKIEQRRNRGVEVGPSLLFQEGRLQSLKRQVQTELTTFAQQTTEQVTNLQRDAVEAVPDQTFRLMEASLGRARLQQIRAITTTWSHLPSGAVTELVGRASDGSPLRDLFLEIAPTAAQRVEDTLISAVVQGLHPTETARELRNVFGVGLNRALNIARTETITAYREGTRQTYRQNTDVLEGWIWHSALGPTTCAACWAMHGTLHSADEKLDGHPRCRCAMVPFTKSWEALGFEGLPDTRPDIPRGTELFNRASAATQLSVLGPKGYALYKAGKVDLVDFLGRKDNPRWGTMRFTRSLIQIDRHLGGFQIGREALAEHTPVRTG
jgi:SPP1 gp7 family putative phage head morphogenesis protein